MSGIIETWIEHAEQNSTTVQWFEPGDVYVMPYWDGEWTGILTIQDGGHRCCLTVTAAKEGPAAVVRGRATLPAGDPVCDGYAHLGCTARAPKIRGENCALGDNSLDPPHDGACGIWMTEVIQHHRSCPDLPDRVRDSLARYVGSRAMNWFEQTGVIAIGVDVRTRGDSDRPRICGAEIGEDVAEEVTGHHDVEPIRVQHEVCREDVDVGLSTSTSRYCVAIVSTR